MELAEIYGDAAGETHIRRTVIDFEMRDFAPPSQPLGVSAEMPSSASLFLTAPPRMGREFPPDATEAAGSSAERQCPHQCLPRRIYHP